MRAALAAQAIASLLVVTLLGAALQPCPTPRSPVAEPTGGPRSHASHDSETEPGASGLAAHEPCSHPTVSLRAPCTCGCADTAGADASPFRLPPGLLAAGASSATPLAPLAPDAVDGTLPSSPRQPIEHVPLRRSA